jgi:hypothetical protein
MSDTSMPTPEDRLLTITGIAFAPWGEQPVRCVVFPDQIRVETEYVDTDGHRGWKPADVTWISALLVSAMMWHLAGNDLPRDGGSIDVSALQRRQGMDAGIVPRVEAS